MTGHGNPGDDGPATGRTGGEAVRTPRSSPLRRLAFRCGAFAGATLLMVVACEILLRIFAPIPFHEWAIWESEGHIGGRLMPNQVILTATGHEFRVNKDGFRGPDYTYDKPPGSLRIEVFGGSAGLCYKAAGRAKSWPGALELKLQERLGMPVEVINLSLAGFTAFNSKINYLCFGRAFHPDAIIVYHTWNDMSTIRRLEKAPYIPKGIPQNKPLWMRIARATQIGRRARVAEFVYRGREMDIISSSQEGSGQNLDRPVIPMAFDWERQNFLDFVRLARGDDVLPILVSQAGLATPENLRNSDIRRHFAGGALQRGFTTQLAVDTWMRISTLIEDVARSNDAIFVDGYTAVPHDLKHVRDNVHLFDAGSEILAQSIFDVLMGDQRFQQCVQRVRRETTALNDVEPAEES